MKTTRSLAVEIARAHVEAWSNHDYDTARAALAPDVKVTATSTQDGLPVTNLTGADDYMKGLVMFADPIRPGSLEIEASFGDDQNALLVVTVELQGGMFPGVTRLRGARLYRIDEGGKITAEQVVFYLSYGSG